jgi:hypothetical protein
MLSNSRLLTCTGMLVLLHSAASFMTAPTSISSYQKSQSVVSLGAVPEKSEMGAAKKLSLVGASAMLLASMLLNPIPAFADEIGRETEAATDFTGETVEVRGWIQGHKKLDEKLKSKILHVFYYLDLHKTWNIGQMCHNRKEDTRE